MISKLKTYLDTHALRDSGLVLAGAASTAFNSNALGISAIVFLAILARALVKRVND